MVPAFWVWAADILLDKYDNECNLQREEREYKEVLSVHFPSFASSSVFMYVRGLSGDLRCRV